MYISSSRHKLQSADQYTFKCLESGYIDPLQSGKNQMESVCLDAAVTRGLCMDEYCPKNMQCTCVYCNIKFDIFITIKFCKELPAFLWCVFLQRDRKKKRKGYGVKQTLSMQSQNVVCVVCVSRAWQP